MSNVLIGFANVLQPINLLICLGGLAVGVLFGALPGFSATMAVAVFVPFTIYWCFALSVTIFLLSFMKKDASLWFLSCRFGTIFLEHFLIIPS